MGPLKFNPDPLQLDPGNVMATPRFQREAGAKKCFAKNFCEKTSAKNFDNARLGHPFSLVSGARSAEKILLLQPWRAQRGENFVFAPLARAARRKILQR